MPRVRTGRAGPQQDEQERSSDPRCPVCRSTAVAEARSPLHQYRQLQCLGCDLQFSSPMTAPGTDFYGGRVDYEEALPAGAKAMLEDAYVGRSLTKRSRGELGPNNEVFLQRLPNKGGRLLDLGCGEGLFLSYAQQAGYEVAGTDIDHHSVDAAKKLYALSNVSAASVAETVDLYQAERFDVICVFEVIEHLEDPLEGLRHAARLLSDNGVLVISVPNRLRKNSEDDPTDWPPHHLTRWTATAIEKTLTLAGLRVRYLDHRKTDSLGRFETGWLIPSIVDRLLTRFARSPADHRFNVHSPYWLRRLSRFLWFPLWPYYAFTRQPTAGLYVEAIGS